MPGAKRFWGNIVLLLTVVLLPLLLGAPAATAATEQSPLSECSGPVTRAVTAGSQAQDLWCWAATDQAIMRYRGTWLTQCMIASVGLNREDCCDCGVCCNSTLATSENVGVFAYWGYGSVYVARALTLNEVITEIDAYRPFYASRNNHAHTVAGYDTCAPGSIYRFDPAPGAGWGWRSYADFSNGWARTVYQIS